MTHTLHTYDKTGKLKRSGKDEFPLKADAFERARTAAREDPGVGYLVCDGLGFIVGDFLAAGPDQHQALVKRAATPPKKKPKRRA